MLTVTMLLMSATTVSAATTHIHERDFHATETQHDVNICGDLATFEFVTTSHLNFVDTGAGGHFVVHEVGKYTVTFDDPALGVWSGHFSETTQSSDTPSGVGTFTSHNNAHEGPVRIHEQLHITFDPDGVPKVVVDRTDIDFGACG